MPHLTSKRKLANSDDTHFTASRLFTPRPAQDRVPCPRQAHRCCCNPGKRRARYGETSQRKRPQNAKVEMLHTFVLCLANHPAGWHHGIILLRIKKKSISPGWHPAPPGTFFSSCKPLRLQSHTARCNMSIRNQPVPLCTLRTPSLAIHCAGSWHAKQQASKTACNAAKSSEHTKGTCPVRSTYIRRALPC